VLTSIGPWVPHAHIPVIMIDGIPKGSAHGNGNINKYYIPLRKKYNITEKNKPIHKLIEENP
jgi:hypothetical protein